MKRNLEDNSDRIVQGFDLEDDEISLLNYLETCCDEEDQSNKETESSSVFSSTSDITNQQDEIQRQQMHLQFRQDIQLTKARWLRSHLPRIVKTDIRKKYPLMLTNVFNSLDYSMVRSFLTSFCHPNQTVFNHLASFPSAKNTIPICMFQLKSVEDIIRYIGGMQQLTPDLVFTLKSFQIIRRPDCDGSILKCQFHGSGTHIYPLHPGMIAACIEYHNHHQSQRKRRKISLMNDLTEEIALSSEVGKEPQSILYQYYQLDDPKSVHSCGVPLLAKPIRREVESTVLFQLDESFRICKLSFDAEVDGADLSRCGSMP